MAKSDVFDLKSIDVATDKREELRRCLGQSFPEVFTEGTIDFNQLKRVLGEWVDPDKERFGLNWPGKAERVKIIQEASIATLKPAYKKSIDFDETENVFIEGDNLEVLKLLQRAYFGKVKMIYIDPPYNTGKEFIYPDKYSESLKTYLAYTGQIDSDGHKFSTNTEATGRYHSHWLNMMYPRLYMARSLLRDDGVFFVSIGDKEYANLRALCNDIFGEENFISTISRVMKTGGAKGNFFTPNVDFILVYAQNIENTEYFRTKIGQYQIDNYYKKIQPDGPRKGERYGEERLYKASLDPRLNQRYWIECPDGSFVIPPGPTLPSTVSEGEKVKPTSEDGVWKWTYSAYDAQKKAQNIVFKETNKSALIDQAGNLSKWNIYNKLWLKDQQEKGKLPSNFLSDFENRQSSAELKEIQIPFDYAKPTSLIRHLIDISGAAEDDIILDFFAGSGSTANAVMQINSEEYSCLRSISVQLPELTQPKSEEYKAGYKTISQLALERIRRGANKIKSKIKSSLEINDPRYPDLGVKVFRLDRSCFKIWDGRGQGPIEQKIQMHLENICNESSSKDLLYELLLKSGFQLTTKVKSVEMAGKNVFSIGDGELLFCLEKELSMDLIEELAGANPLQGDLSGQGVQRQRSVEGECCPDLQDLLAGRRIRNCFQNCVEDSDLVQQYLKIC